MRNIAVRTVFAQGREFIYTLERKMVKNMNLRIRRDGSIYVSANDFISDREVDGFTGFPSWIAIFISLPINSKKRRSASSGQSNT